MRPRVESRFVVDAHSRLEESADRSNRSDRPGGARLRLHMARRPPQEMPDDVRRSLDERDLAETYDERPFYQRNDYLAWIGRGKQPETRRRRIDQMLDELEKGGVYMKMSHRPSERP